MLHRLGVDNEFKISVYMGNDNPYAALWTLLGAKLFTRDDGTSPLIGFNWSNSINNQSRRDELIEIAGHVANISAKHEGADPEIDQTREHPSDILDYFRDKEEIKESGDWDYLAGNFMDKFIALNKTAQALTENGLSFLAASKLHS